MYECEERRMRQPFFCFFFVYFFFFFAYKRSRYKVF